MFSHGSKKEKVMDNLISVIVPVYNVEKYLDECVESLVNQTYKNLEIILVDDGSTDASGIMCDIWAEKDDRIKVFHKENGGGARGAVIKGVRESSGDYIVFLDSDDYYKPEAFEVLLENILKYDADCLQFESFYVDKDKVQTHTKRHFEILNNRQLCDEAVKQYLITGSGRQTQWSYARTDKFYKAHVVKSIIDKLDPKVTIYEDINMSLWIATVCEKVVFLEDCYIYCWRYVENSISKRIIDSTIPAHEYFLNSLKEFAVANGYDYPGLTFIKDSTYVDLMVMALFNKIPLGKKIKYLKELKGKVSGKKAVFSLADNHAFLTRNALKYVAGVGCVLPAVLSGIYLKLKG